MESASLVEQARAGDIDAFTMLVQRHQAMVFGYAFATLRDGSLAEDAAQLAFITAWRNLDNLRYPERFGSWLRTIVRYECLHLLRQRRLETTPLDLAERVAATDPSPADAAEDEEAIARAVEALNALPDTERLAMVLYSIHDHSQREVAAFLDLPVTTVNNRLRSARRRLRQEGFYPMTTDSLAGHGPADDFAEAIGRIVRRDRGVIDARFPMTQRPPILNEVVISTPGAGAPVSAQVAQYLNDDLVRCVVLSDPNLAAEPAASLGTVRDLAQPVSVPMTPVAIRQVIGTIGRATADAAPIETGIKVIDLFCPLVIGATVGIVGAMQSGKMVLVEELIHRLQDASSPVRLLVFVETTTEVAAIRQLEYRTSPTVEAVYLPVADASPEALIEATDGLDAVITFSRELGKAGLYPAIDPLRSTSRWLDAGSASDAHRECVHACRELLAGLDHLARQETLRSYLSQPFHVAQPFTGLAGEDVPLATTMADCMAILAGEWDAVSPESLRMTGALAMGSLD